MIFEHIYIYIKKLSDFFSHKNYSYLTALSKFGKLNHTNKSNTISILEALEPRQHNVPKFDTIIFDGACSCSTKYFLQIHLRPFNNIAEMSCTVSYCIKLIK